MTNLLEEINTNLPFVIFKKPKSGILNIIQQKTNDIFNDVNLKTEGFYFYPFDVSEYSAIVFPKQQTDTKKILIREVNTEFSALQISSNQFDKYKANHILNVKKAIENIEESEKLKKVIISNKMIFETDGISWTNSLLNLMNTYENSFVWYWHHPKIGTWMGATPELLASYQDKHFQTMALAGTLPVKNDEIIEWTPKEIHEQQYVTDYIAQILKSFTDKIKISYPKTIYQGKIAHIKTDIEAEITEFNINNVIKSLHPTPAVCGLPTATAKNIISEIETYKRKYYTGFLGNKTSNKMDFFVNLRTIEFIGNGKIAIYVGGGITSESIPEKEWLEIVNKANVLLRNISK